MMTLDFSRVINKEMYSLGKYMTPTEKVVFSAGLVFFST